jgi:hypothetical protein
MDVPVDSVVVAGRVGREVAQSMDLKSRMAERKSILKTQFAKEYSGLRLTATL